MFQIIAAGVQSRHLVANAVQGALAPACLRDVTFVLPSPTHGLQDARTELHAIGENLPHRIRRYTVDLSDSFR